MMKASWAGRLMALGGSAALLAGCGTGTQATGPTGPSRAPNGRLSSESFTLQPVRHAAATRLWGGGVVVQNLGQQGTPNAGSQVAISIFGLPTPAAHHHYYARLHSHDVQSMGTELIPVIPASVPQGTQPYRRLWAGYMTTSTMQITGTVRVTIDESTRISSQGTPMLTGSTTMTGQGSHATARAK